MRIQTKLGMAIATAIMVPALVLAQAPPPPPDEGGPEPGGPMMAEEMGGGGPEMEMDHPDGGPEAGMPHMGGGPGMGMRGMGMGHHRGHGGMGLMFLVNSPEMRKQLGITDEQAAKIRQQTLDFEKTEIRQRADLQVKRLELRNLMTAENPDRAAIDRAVQEVGAARVAAEKAAVNHHLDMRAALTAEQRQKLQEMRHEFMQRRGPGGPGGRGPRGMMHHGAAGGQAQEKPQSEQ